MFQYADSGGNPYHGNTDIISNMGRHLTERRNLTELYIKGYGLGCKLGSKFGEMSHDPTFNRTLTLNQIPNFWGRSNAAFSQMS